MHKIHNAGNLPGLANQGGASIHKNPGAQYAAARGQALCAIQQIEEASQQHLLRLRVQIQLPGFVVIVYVFVDRLICVNYCV